MCFHFVITEHKLVGMYYFEIKPTRQLSVQKVMGSEDKTHLGIHVASGSTEEPEFSNIKNRHEEQLKRYTEPEKQVHNDSYRLKTPSV